MSSLLNQPKWMEVNSVGERTGVEYFGRFLLKPFLSHKESTDAQRLTELYNRGLEESFERKNFNAMLAFLKFHVVDTDAEWYKSDSGLDALDEKPFYDLVEKVSEVQKSVKKTDNKEAT